MPIHAAGSIHGPVYEAKGRRIARPTPRVVGYVNVYGQREPAHWRWDDPCPLCATDTEFGYCTRCTWVCDNTDRPAPEPLHPADVR